MVASFKAKRPRAMEPILVKQKTAARLCDVCPKQIRTWEASGLLRSVMVGTTKLYPYAQLKALAGGANAGKGGFDGVTG